MRRIALSAFTLVSCAAYADVVQVSGDTYMAYQISHAGAFANMAKLKAAVIREANDFASRQGKLAIPVSAAVEKRPSPGFPSVEYQFRVVDKSDPNSLNQPIPAQANLIVENNGHTSTEIQTKVESKPDLYSELMKLDDLRKRGLLTDQEFDAQKKRLLERAP